MPKDRERRPAATAFNQQKLHDWSPRIGERGWVAIYYGLSVLLLIMGVTLLAENIQYKEWTYIYDGTGAEYDTCSITSGNEGRECEVTFTFDEDVSGTLYVYYGLTNFNQNNRRYTKSYYSEMMIGTSTSDIDTDTAELECYPLIYNGTKMLYPCGLEAMTFFNDEISLSGSTTVSGATMDTDGISYTVEEDTKYQQVDGFVYSAYTTGQTCSEVLGAQYVNGCESYTGDDGTTYYYYYPDSDNFQYLHEVFPQISPLKGVEDENFIVWMRLAAFPTFRKPLGKIDTDVKAGESLVFTVVNNFDVTSFDGSKRIIVSTNHNNNVYISTFWIMSFIMSFFTFCGGTLLLYRLEPQRWEELKSLWN